MIVQVPAVTIVAVVPDTVQTLVVELAKVTVESDVSVALPRGNVPAPPATHVWEPGGVQVIVWGTASTVTEREGEVNDGLADDAVIKGVPIAVPVSVSEAVPDTAVTEVRPDTVPVPPDCTNVMAPTNEVMVLLYSSATEAVRTHDACQLMADEQPVSRTWEAGPGAVGVKEVLVAGISDPAMACRV